MDYFICAVNFILQYNDYVSITKFNFFKKVMES